MVLVWLAMGAVACNCETLDEFDDGIDRSCDCGGLTLAVYDDCYGVVTVADEDVSSEDFAAACFDAVDNDDAEGLRYQCLIEAVCDAKGCEDLAKRMRLCSY